MPLKDIFLKHNEGSLRQEEWEGLAQELINAKFDAEKQAVWSQLLQRNGVYRSPSLSARTSRSIPIRKYLAAASVLLVLTAASWFFFLRSPFSEPQMMASQYLEQPFEINQGTTRGEGAIEKNRGKAYEAFDLKEYEKSLSYLQMIEADGQAKAADYFQMGLCLIYQKQPNYMAAIGTFKAAQKADSTEYSDEILWYSALCYLMLDDEEQATEALQKVVDSPSSRKQADAKRLLDGLKK